MCHVAAAAPQDRRPYGCQPPTFDTTRPGSTGASLRRSSPPPDRQPRFGILDPHAVSLDSIRVVPIHRFGLFEFDADAGELRREGRLVPLEPQPARVLAALLARPGALVSHDDLKQATWDPGTFVDFERGLAYCLSQVRGALGDTARNPRFVETVPRRGYRFIAPVHPPEGQASATVTSADAATPPDAPPAEVFGGHVARGARIVVSSRPKTPFAAALARATGRTFVAISPAERLPWYLPPTSRS